MRNNETGEFELVVGNKQLLSGFFVVVVAVRVGVRHGHGIFDWLLRIFGRKPYWCKLCNTRFNFQVQPA